MICIRPARRAGPLKPDIPTKQKTDMHIRIICILFALIKLKITKPIIVIIIDTCIPPRDRI
jgi:hypothetical protein